MTAREDFLEGLCMGEVLKDEQVTWVSSKRPGKHMESLLPLGVRVWSTRSHFGTVAGKESMRQERAKP